MSSIEIRFGGGIESQKIFIPASTGKKKIHLLFSKSTQDDPESIDKALEKVETLIIGDKMWYGCQICDNKFSQMNSAKHHVKVHHLTPKNFLCGTCGKAFRLKSDYAKHCKMHLEKPHQCEICSRRFSTLEKLKIHSAGQHDGRERRYQCGNCSKLFLTLQHLKQHVLVHSDDYHFRCEVCNKGFLYERTYKKHVMAHSKQEKTTCKVCDKVCKTEFSLKRHYVRVHNLYAVHQEKDESSMEKSEDSVDKDTLEAPTVADKNSLEGDQDEGTEHDTASHDKGRNQKLKKDHGKDEKMETEGNKSQEITVTVESVDKETLPGEGDCTENSGATENMDEQMEHQDADNDNANNNAKGTEGETIDLGKLDIMEGISIITNGPIDKDGEQLYRPRELSFICNICNKSFTRKESLQNHFRMHTGEKPFKCRHCNQCFRQRAHLIRHFKVHSGEKNHVCLVCSKPFTRIEHLREHHKRKHLPESHRELGFCKHCGKKFAYLDKHMKSKHSNKNLHCNGCGLLFMNEAKFKKHIVNGQHLKEDHVNRTCTICFQLFSRSDHVRRHMVAVHGQEGQIELLTCSLCDREFTDEASFKRHLCKGKLEEKKGKPKKLKKPRTAPRKGAKYATEVNEESSNEAMELVIAEDNAENESNSGEEIEVEQDGFQVLEFIID